MEACSSINNHSSSLAEAKKKKKKNVKYVSHECIHTPLGPTLCDVLHHSTYTNAKGHSIITAAQHMGLRMRCSKHHTFAAGQHHMFVFSSVPSPFAHHFSGNEILEPSTTAGAAATDLTWDSHPDRMRNKSRGLV